MSKEILEQLFDSPIKVKLLKLFFRNPEESFRLKEIVKRVKGDARVCRRQIKKLENINLLSSRAKKGVKSYFVNPDFDFYKELKTLVLKSSPASRKKMLSRLRGLGMIKLALISGIFLNLENSRVDLLIVGDRIEKKKITNFLRDDYLFKVRIANPDHLRKIGLDFILGGFFVLILGWSSTQKLFILIGIIAALLPDFLELKMA